MGKKEMKENETNATILKTEFQFLKEFSLKNFFKFLRERKSLAVTLLAALLFMYGLKLAHFLYGVDTELHMEYQRFVNWIQIGRFGLVALQKLWMRGTFFNPYSAIFIALVFLYFGTLSFCYMIYEFSRRKTKPILYYIFALTFASGGVWCEQLYFTLQAAECLFAMAVVPVNVWILYRGLAFKNSIATALNILLTAFIISVYQGIFPLYAGAVFACYVLERDSWTESTNEKTHFALCTKMLASMLAAVILYFALSKLVQVLTHTTSSKYLTEQIGGKEHNKNLPWIIYLGLYIYKLTIGNIAAVNNFFAPIFAAYARGGESSAQNIALESMYANFLYIPATIAFLFFAMKNSQKSPLRILSALALVGCVLAMPIAGGGSVAMRAQFIIPFATAFMFVYSLQSISNLPFKVCTAILFANCFFGAQVIGDLNYSDKLRFDADARLAEDIDSRLSHFMNENEIDHETPVYLFNGVEQRKSDNFIQGEVIGYRSFIWDFRCAKEFPVRTSRPLAFMNTLLMNYTIGRDEGFAERCKAEIERMPPYPDKDCIRYFDGAIIMKLSEDAKASSLSHNQ